jgi:hypothetical protein
MTLRAFFRWSAAPDDIPTDLRDFIAEFAHADYRRRHLLRKAPGDPALAPWEALPAALKRSNYAQADDVPNKLAALKKRLARAGAPLALSEDEIEKLAEIEHGRWNVERLRTGWRLGERQISRLISPHLKPWDELRDEDKNYDREAVSNIPDALAEKGWGVIDCED